jgi:prepilin-type N-terminal cleavage/methylation domain-containing protein
MYQSISNVIQIRLANRSGFTLMELVAVIVIMGIVAAVALRSMDKVLVSAKIENTKLEMEQIANSITGNPDLFSNGVRTDFGYVGDVGTVPPNLDYLTTDVGGFGTWSGPYINNDFSEAADGYKRDAWGNLYTYNGTTIQSSGGGAGTITRQICSALSDLTSNSVKGSIADAAGNPPGSGSPDLTVILRFPDGAGSLTEVSAGVSAGGLFEISGSVPVGIHLIRAIYSPTSDTVSSYVSVMPGNESIVNLRLPGALWAGH